MRIYRNTGWSRFVILLLAPALFLITLFFLIPMVSIFSTSFSESTGELKFSAFTLKHYVYILTSKFYIFALLRTFRMGILVTIFSFLIGYPLAYYMIRVVRSKTWLRLIYVIVVAPLFVSSVVRTFGWIVVLGRRGVVNNVLTSLGILGTPVNLLFNEKAVIIGLCYILVPFMVLTVTSVLQNIRKSFEEAAQDLGANRFRTFLSVTFPLSLPGVIAGSLIVFTLAVSSYVTPSILGGGKYIVLPMLVFNEFMMTFNLAFGSALACILLFCTLVVVLIYMRIMH